MSLFIKEIPADILEEIRSVTRYCPLTGSFVYRVKTNTRNWAGKDVGAPGAGGHGHMVFQYRGKKYMCHRVIWALMFGPVPDGIQVDHINGNKHDNRIENLRLVTHGENMQNRRSPSSTKKSGLPLGTYYNKADRNWFSNITYGGKAHRLGTFPTPEAAHQAYLEAKRRLHPGCTI